MLKLPTSSTISIIDATRCNQPESRSVSCGRIKAMSQSVRLATLSLLVTAFIWGTTFVVTKVALHGFLPLTLTMLRFVLALAVLLPLALREGGLAESVKSWRRLAALGFTGGFLYFATQNVGLAYTSAAQTSLILASIPALIVIGSGLALREHVPTIRLLAAVLSAAGVIMIIAGDGSGGIAGGSLFGDLLIVVSAFSWTAYTLLGKAGEDRMSPITVTAGTMGFGAVFLIPLVAGEVATQRLPVPSMESLLALAYLGLVASAVPFLLWNYALTKVDASEAGVYINLVPVIAVASGAFLLGESVTVWHLFGGSVVLGGVWLASAEHPLPRLRRASGSH